MQMTLSILRIVFIYALFSIAWILFSDRMLESLISDITVLGTLQTYKGLFFIGVTSLLLFALISKQMHKIAVIEKKATMRQQRLEYVIQGANLGYWDWNYITNEHTVNDIWLSFLGLTRQDIEEKIIDWEDRIHPMDKTLTKRAIEQTIKHNLPYIIEFRMQHSDGHWVWIEGSGAVVERDEKTSAPLRLAGTHRDISDRKKAQEKMLFFALNDPLTSLPNRTYLKQHLEKLLLDNQSLAFLFLDLDYFKNINDMYGHSIGDEVIKIVAKRFSNCLQETDFLARVGGDEFVIVTWGHTHVKELAQALIDSLNSLIHIEKEAFKIGVSIGVALAPQNGHTFGDLFKNADTAMYEAKSSGKNGYVFYQASMTENILHTATLDNDLRHAIEHDEFVIYFQPQIHFSTNRVIGLEALVRWEHPQKGLVPPMGFIGRAEENRLIIPLGELIFEKVLKQLKQWEESFIFQGVVAINISSVQIEESHFVEKIEAIRQKIGINASKLELEITESCVMNHPVQSAHTLQKLENLGYKISIDDFGTGFSSLSYLKQLPLHKLKIDRSFIKDLPHDKDDRAISKAIIVLAKTLELEVLAEGVESEEQKTFLIQNGCDSAQGYLLGKPMSAKALEVYLGQN